MNGERNEVTVFRSADPSANDDAAEVLDLLLSAGLEARLLTERDPGVPVGAFEVRVPEGQEQRAEALIGEAEEQPPAKPVDNSADLDLEVLFEGVGATAEMEAVGVRTVLDANQISAVLASPGPYPNLPFLVKVPRNQIDEARRVLAEAREAGPLAAEEAERATEAAD